jgi:transglutaminase-like putative cysteine protease
MMNLKNLVQHKAYFAVIFIIFLSACESLPDFSVYDDASEIPAYLYQTGSSDKSIRNLPQEIKKYQKKDPEKFLNMLASYITENSTNDFERVKKAHDWIALNIRYDMKSFLSGSIPSQRSTDVLKTGLSVCAGYADIFHALCDIMKIENEIVNGYARGYGYSADEAIDINHAWNKVEIYGNWYLVDCTWDAGGASGKHFSKNYQTSYLFAAPEIFIGNHFPANPENQLLATPVKDYNEIPANKYYYYRAMRGINPLLKKINYYQSDFSAEFTVKDAYLIFEVYHDDRPKGLSAMFYTDKNLNVVTEKVPEGVKYKVTYSFEKPGEYLLKCYQRMDDFWDLLSEYTLVYSPE